MRNVPLKLAAIGLGILGFCMVAAAAPTAPLIYGSEEEVRTHVTPTGSFVELGADTRKENVKLPGVAEKVDQKRLFRWKPSPAGAPMGGADLTDAVLSPDGTLFCVAEQIGGAGNLNSTRLVLINPEKGILGGPMLEEVRVLRLGFLPEGALLWLLAESGRNTDKAPAFLIYDLTAGKVIARSRPLAFAPGRILSAGESLWVASRNDRTLFRYDLKNFAAEPERLSAPFVISALTPRKQELLAFGEGGGAVYAIRDGKAFQTGSIPVPPGLCPEWCRLMPGEDAVFAVSTADGKGGVLNDGKFSVLRESDAAPGWIFPEGKRLIFGDRQQEFLHPFRLPDLEPDKTVKPGKERPATRNRTFCFFALPDKIPSLLQMDERGNVFTVQMDGRRVRKTPVLIVDRTGFR